tara:strand:+ start:204 stop:458 length:255 start_codon:yes stop_codon:yes gene_type:complete
MPKSKRIKLTDIRIAIAKECLTYKDYSKETITRITKAYLAQLKKDFKDIEHWRYKKPPTVSVNATKVQFEIEKLKKNGTFDNTN